MTLHKTSHCDSLATIGDSLPHPRGKVANEKGDVTKYRWTPDHETLSRERAHDVLGNFCGACREGWLRSTPGHPGSNHPGPKDLHRHARPVEGLSEATAHTIEPRLGAGVEVRTAALAHRGDRGDDE